MKIEWTLPGWYKAIERDDDIVMVSIAPKDATKEDAQKLGGLAITFYQKPPSYMEVVESNILDLLDFD